MTLAVHSDGDVYIGGFFTTDGAGAAASYICLYDPGASTFAALGVGLDDNVYALTISKGGLVYIGGGFTTAGGTSASRIVVWNGTSYAALGAGVNADVNSLSLGRDGVLYIAGEFATGGGIVAYGLIAWNGSSFIYPDAYLGAPDGYAVLASAIDIDPVVVPNYSVWFGYNLSGTAYFAGTISPNNQGTEACYPRLIFKRSGGTAATLWQVRNETTGKTLSFNYSLLNGETLTVDLRPTKKSIISSFFGPRPDAILAASDMGTFALLSGTNQITAFINVAGAPTITANLEWRNCYLSQD
jgi:hypothetical protein